MIKTSFCLALHHSRFQVYSLINQSVWFKDTGQGFLPDKCVPFKKKISKDAVKSVANKSKFKEVSAELGARLRDNLLYAALVFKSETRIDFVWHYNQLP